MKVRINDRGPFIAGRIVDLSQAAAVALGILERGTAPVRIEVYASDRPEGPTLERFVRRRREPCLALSNR